MLDQHLRADRSRSRAQRFDTLDGAGSWGTVLTEDDGQVIVLVDGIDYGPVPLVPADLGPSEGDQVFLLTDAQGQPAYAIDPTSVTTPSRSRADVLMAAEGLAGQTIPRSSLQAASSPSTGVVYLQPIVLKAGVPVSNAHVIVNTAGSGFTLCKIGLYDALSPYTPRAATADLGSAWASTGTKTHAFTTPFTPPETAVYAIGFVAVFSGTPQISRGRTVIPGNHAAVNGGIGVGYLSGSGNTDLPATGSALNSAAPIAWWIGVS